ncbi:MAG: ATP-binding protein [Myxococcales bacterium]|nr:ATP-binding protein [Myxococcales bacterium]
MKASLLLSTCAGIHLLIGITYVALYAMARRAREFASFAAVSFAFALTCAGAALVPLADDLAASTRGLELRYLGIALVILAVQDFLRTVGPSEGLRLARLRLHLLVPIWAALGLIALGAGLFFDPSSSLPGAREPAPSPLLLVWVGIVIALSFAVIPRLPAQILERASSQLVRWGTLVCSLVLAADLGGTLFARPSTFLLEPLSVVISLLLSYALSRRFIELFGELDASRVRLELSSKEIRETQAALVRKEQLAAIGELSAVIAHEVRNPLAVLKNAAAGLRRDDLPADDRQILLEIVEEETDRLNRLVTDLLAYARPVAPQTTPLPLAPLIEHSVQLVGLGHAKAQQVQIHLHLEACPAEVHGDRDLIERALINILENALEATPAGGEIHLGTSPSEIDGSAAVSIALSDSGAGMDTEIRERATLPFFTTRPSGTGLGLAIVERVIRAHGGRMHLGSRREGGTTVTLQLPLEEPELGEHS